MDRLISEWILRHAMKYSYSRVITEIHQVCPEIKYERYLQKFVLYAACARFCSLKQLFDLDHRKMLWYALTNFVTLSSRVPDDVLRQCSQMILILRWIIAVETIVTKNSSSISMDAFATLTDQNKLFEEEWNTITGSSPIPCEEFLHKVKLKLTANSTNVTDEYVVLIDKLSFYIVSSLKSCLKTLRLCLPSTAIEEMHCSVITYNLKDTKVLPSNVLERFICASAMMKNDSSEEGLLSLVKLMFLKSPEGLVVNDGNKSKHSCRTLAEINIDATNIVKIHQERLLNFKKLSLGLRALHKRKSQDLGQSCDHESDSSNKVGGSPVEAYIEEGVITESDKIDTPSMSGNTLDIPGKVHCVEVSSKRKKLREDEDTTDYEGVVKKWFESGEEASDTSTEGSDAQVTRALPVNRVPSLSPQSSYNLRSKTKVANKERMKRVHCEESEESSVAQSAPSKIIGGTAKLDDNDHKNQVIENLVNNVYSIIKDEENKSLRNLKEDELQFSCSIGSCRQAMEIDEEIVTKEENYMVETSDSEFRSELKEKCFVDFVAIDEVQFSCSEPKSPDLEINVSDQEMDIDSLSPTRTKTNHQDVRRLAKQKMTKAVSDHDSDSTSKSSSFVSSVPGKPTTRSSFSAGELENKTGLTPGTNESDPEEEITILSPREIYFSCSSNFCSQ